MRKVNLVIKNTPLIVKTTYKYINT